MAQPEDAINRMRDAARGLHDAIAKYQQCKVEYDALGGIDPGLKIKTFIDALPGAKYSGFTAAEFGSAVANLEQVAATFLQQKNGICLIRS